MALQGDSERTRDGAVKDTSDFGCQKPYECPVIDKSLASPAIYHMVVAGGNKAGYSK